MTLLSEILKAAPIRSEVLMKLVQKHKIEPRWDDMPLPPGNFISYRVSRLEMNLQRLLFVSFASLDCFQLIAYFGFFWWGFDETICESKISWVLINMDRSFLELLQACLQHAGGSDRLYLQRLGWFGGLPHRKEATVHSWRHCRKWRSLK